MAVSTGSGHGQLRAEELDRAATRDADDAEPLGELEQEGHDLGTWHRVVRAGDDVRQRAVEVHHQRGPRGVVAQRADRVVDGGVRRDVSSR